MPNLMDILPKLQPVKTGQTVRQIHCAEDWFQAWVSGYWLGYPPVVISP